MRVEKTGEQALSTQPEPTGSATGSGEDDADPAARRSRAVTERGWVVEPSPAPVFAIAHGAAGSTQGPVSAATAPAEPPRAASDLPRGGLRQLKAVLDRKDRSRDVAEAAPVAVAEVSNDLAATSGLIERAAPRADEQRARAVTPARVVVDAGWAVAAPPAARPPAEPIDARAPTPRRAGPGSAPPPLPVAPPLRHVAATAPVGAAPGSVRASAAPEAPARPPAPGSVRASAAPATSPAPDSVRASAAPATSPAPDSVRASAAPARPPATPPATATRSTAPTRVVPPVRPMAGAGGFPRSAAERAGATARPARVAQPVPERRAAIPARPPVSARVSAELASIEPPERLPLGSITAPLPTGDASPPRRPSTVELPTLDAPDLPEVVAPPAPASLVRASRPAPVAAPDRALPSILSVIDRRHAPAGASLEAEQPAPRSRQKVSEADRAEPLRVIIAPSVAVHAPAPAAPAVLAAPPELAAAPEVSYASEPIALPEVTIEIDTGAVPEPITPEVSAPTERMAATPSFAPEPVEVAAAPPVAAPEPVVAPRSIDSELHLDSLPPPAASAPRVETPAPAAAPARARPRRSASFSDADAAFFAAGEQMERGEADSFDEESEPVPSLKRPPLWRRITGRHRA